MLPTSLPRNPRTQTMTVPSAANAPATIMTVRCDVIRAGNNDRTVFDETGLKGLASSIKDNGLAQPITVRPLPSEASPFLYEIVAGERRFRACSQNLGWFEIPCIIKDLSDEEASGVMLAENTSRDDLDPIDE